MGKFTVIPTNTFDGLQMDAGVLLKNFDPSNPVAPADSNIICATTGGIKPSCIPTYSDLGEDVDNCPNNMKELKHLDGWDCKLAFTSLGTSEESIRLSLGAADIVDGAIKPRKDLRQSDFSDIWWVGDRADGGCVAIWLKNALSTGGFTLQTGKNAKGQVSVEITGHVSINAQSDMPMVIYSLDPDSYDSYKVTQNLAHVTSDFVESYIMSDDEFEATLTADQDYTISTVMVLMGGEDVTASKYNSSTHKVTIATVTGDIVITASAAS